MKSPNNNSSSPPWNLDNSPTDDEMDTIADNFNIPSPPTTTPKANDKDVTRLSPGPNNFETQVQGLHFSEQYPCSIANPIGFEKT